MPETSIAVIGLSGRYPGGATTPERLWSNLRNGTDAIGEAQGDRWDLGYYNADPEQPGRVYTRAGGFLDSIDGFDAEFFGISPREAKQIDPQQRLLLELAWEALEDAALVPKAVAGSATGVFVGISSHDYADLIGPGAPDAYSNTGSSLSIAANRISYILDLHGPSLAIDTACSSGLVCIHQACRSLIEGACDMALVGAANILANARPWLGFAKASMLSPTGRCKSFDASGDGYVRSEGGGMVLLKPLAAAERDGDTIYGVILATGVNSDGRTLGLSMPSMTAQESLLRQVYAAAGVAAEDVFYVEAHGTGTSVGDPIECEAIGRVLGAPRTDGTRCKIGSVKSNIGHLEPASGIAGLTKVLLALRHRELPANLHFNTPNPKIDFENWKLDVVGTAIALPEQDKPLVIGVNSFGFGGTNAHAVVQDYRAPAVPDAAATERPWSDVLLLSAQNAAALSEMAASYASWLRGADLPAWSEICATAALCRSRHAHRLAVTARSAVQAAEQLDAFVAGETVTGLATGRAAPEVSPVAFVYSGNGPQWWAMGRELLDASATFRAEIDAVDALFEPHAGWSIVDELRRPEQQSRMALTEVAQPTLFALQLGLTAVLAEAGITPAAVFGHSVGEVAAAYASGALDRAQATSVIIHRSTMQARTAGTGRMAALGIGPEDAAIAMAEAMAETGGQLELAAVNAPRAVTVAGDPASLEVLRARLTEAGKFARVLPLDYPFHSRAMDPIRGDLLARLDGLAPVEGSVPFVSTVAGGELAGTALDAEYWWRNIREPVRFADAVDHVLHARGITHFIEIGPHPVLRDYIVQCAKARDVSAIAIQTLRRPAANRPEPEVAALWTAICACHANGMSRPEAVFERPAHPAALPTYPWQRTRHWRGAVALPDTPSPTAREHPLLGWRPRGTDGLWQNAVDLGLLPYLADHVVQDSTLFPAAGYMELGLAAAARVLDGKADEHVLELEVIDILRPFVVGARPIPALECAVDIADGTWEVRSRPDVFAQTWTTHVRSRLTRGAVMSTTTIDLEALRSVLTDSIDGAAHYADSRRRGLFYGPAFQGVRQVRMSPAGAAINTAIADIELPMLDDAALAGYRAHPAVLDACLQVLIALLGRNEQRLCAFIPVQVERLRSFAALPARVVCQVIVTRESERSGSADFTVTDPDGTVLLTLTGARFRKVDFRSIGIAPLVTEGWRIDPHVAGQTAATPLPSPAEIGAGIAATVTALAESTQRDAYHAIVAPALETLVGAYAGQALLALGAADKPFSLPQLQRRGRVQPERAALLARLVAMAAEDGLLTREGAVFTWQPERLPAEPAGLWRALMLGHPGHAAELVLAARHGEQLVETLRSATAVGSDAVDAATEQLHDGSPFRSLSMQMLQAAIRALVADLPAGRSLRVLEIGGATGGLTAAMLPLLAASRADYLFTDAAQASLDRAQQLFAGHHGLRMSLYNLNEAPSAQGLAGGGFDLVLAGDTLHETPDRATALAHIRGLLAPGGWLCLVERTGSRLEALLASGATPPEATGLHLIDAAGGDGWQAALGDAGFEAITRVAEPDGGALQHLETQSVLLSQRPAEATTATREIAATARRWLLLASDNATEAGFATAVAGRLREQGQSVEVMALGGDGGAFRTAGDMDAARLVAADDIVHLAGLAGDDAAMLDLEDLRCLSTLSLVQSIKAAENGYKPRLHLVTHGAFAGPAGLAPLDPAQAPLWGIGRVLANEHPDLAPRLVDLHAPLDDAAAAALADELLRHDEEVEVLLAGGQRYVNRMQPTTLTQLAAEAVPLREPAAEPAFRLDIGNQGGGGQGGIDSLFLRAVPRVAPGPGQVELRVRAAGLNFRDVLWAMGMLPEEAVEHGFSGATIGMECSGEIVAIGSDVTNFAVGDRVVAFAASTFASNVTTSAGAVSRLPDGMGYAEAATIPTTFLTAFYALEHLARLRPGERVLIHGAAGGVGLAAVQIAQWRGAIVFGTAGSEEKRRVLRLMGVDHVLNSRSLDFADDVMRLTGDQGVDVVLNSLAGEAITKNLQILRPFGRFLEIGKRDFYANSRIGLRPFRRNLSYFGIDADTLLIERADLAQQVFAEVMALFATGALRPLPFTAVPVARAASAFRLMQQSRHIGKIVLTMAPDGAALPAVNAALSLRGDATWLVTGGLGGFGLATARWLVDQGVRSLALVGRRGATTDEARDGIAAIEAAGATVRAFAADVTSAEDVARILAEIDADMPPLRGVVHAAMVLDDGPIVKLDGERLRRVLAPKLLGARNLHEATRNLPLDHFVMFSSGTTVVGNPGQANYVAANMYLDALAQYRRAHGLPALAVAWGAIKDVGVLARNVGVEEMLQNRTGLGAIPAAEALADLGRLMAVDATRVSVAQFNLQRLGTLLPGTRTPRFLPMAPQSVVAALTQASETLAGILAATPAAEHRNVIVARLREHVGRVLGTGAGQVDTGRSLSEMGLDSLMAVELAESLEQDIGKPVSVMQLIQAGSVLAITELMVVALGGQAEAEPGAPGAAAGASAADRSKLAAD